MTLYVPGGSGLSATCNCVGSPPVDLRLTTRHHGTALAAYFNSAEGWLQLLSEP